MKSKRFPNYSKVYRYCGTIFLRHHPTIFLYEKQARLALCFVEFDNFAERTKP